MSKAPMASNLRDRAYQAIRQQILDAELPPGAALSEYQLSAALSISRTPVREALRQLEREGLVVVVPQRGTFIAEITARDVLEIYQVREQLEGMAARLAAERMPDETIEWLESELNEGLASAESDPSLAFDADVHLHKQIIAITQNRRLERILATLDDQVHIIRQMAHSTTGRLQLMTHEHVEVIRAIRAHDAAEAERLMRLHLQAARDNALKSVMPV